MALLVCPRATFSQGCVPARLLSPSWFLQADTLRAKEWSMTASYRFFNSFRDIQGSKALPVPSPPDIYADTNVHGLDLGLTYALTSRLSFTLDAPLQYGSRETYVEHGDGSAHTMRAGGLGDMRVVANVWLFDTEKHPNQNIALSMGLKIPTDARATDYSYHATGPVLRPVDPAIQPGDGSWGFLVGANAFKRLSRGSFAYFQGVYLVNPRQMNKTETVFGDNPDLTGGDIGYIIDSVPDQFLGRAGVGRAIWRAKGISGMLGARIDGVPQEDLIGGSDGFRLPGYSLSVDPGVSIVRGKSLFAFTIPIAVKRHVSYAVADKRTNSPYGGIMEIPDSQPQAGALKPSVSIPWILCMASASCSAQTLVIALYDYADLSAKEVVRLTETADMAFAHSGIHLAWRHCRGALVVPDATTCKGEMQVNEIVMRLQPGEPRGSNDGRMGRSIVTAQGGNYASVIVPAVRAQAAGFGVAFDLLMGYAVAHEVGHCLLGPGHSHAGLMRGRWNRSDAGEMSRLGLQLTKQEARNAVARLTLAEQAAQR